MRFFFIKLIFYFLNFLHTIDAAKAARFKKKLKNCYRVDFEWLLLLAAA